MGGGGGLGSTLGTVAGGVGGFMLGGPAGAAVGAGLGSSLLGSGPQKVDVPNYSGAAQQTSASDLAANRLNQTNAYGSLNYNQTGTDQYGNPTFTQTQSLNPQLQSAINSNLGQLGQGFNAPQFQGQDMASQNYYGSRLNQQQYDPSSMVNTQFDRSQLGASSLPSYGIDPGQTYSDAIMQRLQPSQQRQTQALDAQLANQGIMPGSKAYETAKLLQSQSQNDALTSAIVGGMGVGLQANQQQFGQNFNVAGADLAARQAMNQQGMAANSLAYQQQLANQGLGMQAQGQAFNQSLAESMLPYQQATALKGLAAPSFASYATTMPTNYSGAMQNAYQGNLANANAQNAYQNSMTSGLFNLGGAALMGGSGRTPARVFDYSTPYGS
jgi:hypothetical protein